VAYCNETRKAIVLGSKCIETAKLLGINIKYEVQCKKCKIIKEFKTLKREKYENYLCRKCKRKNSDSSVDSLVECNDNKKMEFGKYRSMTYKTVYETQKSYIRWFLGEIKYCTGPVEDFKKWLYKKEGLCLGCDKKQETGFIGRCGFEVCLNCYTRMECD
jgi:hypothetical protein